MKSDCLNTKYREPCYIDCSDGYLMERTPWSDVPATFYPLPMEYTCALDEAPGETTDWNALPPILGKQAPNVVKVFPTCTPDRCPSNTCPSTTPSGTQCQGRLERPLSGAHNLVLTVGMELICTPQPCGYLTDPLFQTEFEVDMENCYEDYWNLRRASF